jgi:regulator of replication initiation timing
MTERLDAFIELPMLREEVKQLKEYINILKHENDDLTDRLSQRSPATAAETEIGRFCWRCAKRLLVLNSTRRTIQMPLND